MATRQAIDRLAKRIETVGALLTARSRRKVAQVIVDLGETRDEVLERHYAEHPEDRGGPIVIMTIV